MYWIIIETNGAGIKWIFPVSACLQLTSPVFQRQTWYPLKLSHIICHQYRAGGNGVPGNGRVVRADRRAGQPQSHFDICGGVPRGTVPMKVCVEARAERLCQLRMAWRGEAFGPVAPKRISA